MKQSKMLIPTLREMPSDAQVISHTDVACRLCSPRSLVGTYSHSPLANRVIESKKASCAKNSKIGAEMLFQHFECGLLGVNLVVTKLTGRLL